MSDSQSESSDDNPGLGSRHSKDTLFRRLDRIPYEFWVQHDMDAEIRETVQELITIGGGRILPFGEFPQHGFLVLDPASPAALYEIRTSFDKPLDLGMRPYCRCNSIPATPLRHVVSYLFILTAHDRGTWDEFDLIQYGFPLETPRVEEETLKETSERLQSKIPRGLDKRMEDGWAWETGDLFSRYDRSYKFTKEFADLKRRLENELVPHSKDLNTIRRFERGLIVTRRKWLYTTKFFVHPSVSPQKRRKAVEWITTNGGFTCCDESSCDIILLESSIDEIHENEELFGILWNVLRRNQEEEDRSINVMHVDWIVMTQDAKKVEGVNKSRWDLLQKYISRYGRKKPKFGSSSSEQMKKRKRKAIQEELEWRSRTQGANVESATDGFGGPARKRAKLENGAASSKHLNHPSSSSKALATSSVQPRRKFEGVFVPDSRSLLQDYRSRQKATPFRSDSTKTSHQQALVAGSLSFPHESADAHQELAEPQSNKVSAERKAARISAVSGLTTQTAQTTTSKGDNATTTTTTTTTGTLKSARSVGPGNPPNPKQIGRPSVSTAAGSGASRGPVESSIETAPRAVADLFRIPGAPTSLDADDVAVEEILSRFETNAQEPEPNQPDQPNGGSDLRELPFEKRLLSYWNDLVILDDEELVHLEQLVNGWPERAKRKAEANRKRKGKGRVSFASPTARLEEDIVIPEIDLDDDSAAIRTTADLVSSPHAQTVHTVDSQEKPDQPDDPTPPRARARISRQRISSKTPDSHESSSSNGGSSDSETEPARGTNALVSRVSKGVSPVGSNKHPGQDEPNASRALTPKEAKGTAPESNPSNDDQPGENPTAGGEAPLSELAGEGGRKKKTPVRQVQTANLEEGDQREGEEDEDEEDEVPPLIAPKATRTTRLRSQSVVSDQDSINGAFKPRRGRSASAAPPDVPATSAKTVTVAPVKRRGGHATKSTGRRAPKRK